MRLDKLVLIGFLSANLLAPTTGYSNSLEDPRPDNRFERGERKSRHQGPVKDEYCGGPDNPCGSGDEDTYILHPPVPVHEPTVIVRKPDQVIDFTKPEETTTNESDEYQPQVHTENDSQPGYLLLDKLKPGITKTSYFDKGTFHLKWIATSCVNSTGNDAEDLATAIMEVEESFKEEFGINVKYNFKGNHAYDSNQGITSLQIKLGKHKDQYCAEIDARINPMLRK